MKVLITGCTDTHINNPLRAKSTKFMSIPELMTRVLTEMGHVVEHREVVVNENLDSFDRVACFLYPLDKHARHPAGALYTLSARRDAIIAIDDWSYGNICATWGNLVPDLSARTWLAPVFQWGDLEKLGIEANVITYDPSCAMPELRIEKWEQRIPAWVHASFHRSSHEWARYNTMWPTLAYGCKDFAQPRILESTVIKLHGVAAGSLIPPYSHAGSGWWRVRVLHSLWGGTIIGCSGKEFNGLSSSLEHTVYEIEQMTTDAQLKLAEAQHRVIREHLGTQAELYNQLATALDLPL